MRGCDGACVTYTHLQCSTGFYGRVGSQPRVCYLPSEASGLIDVSAFFKWQKGLSDQQGGTVCLSLTQLIHTYWLLNREKWSLCALFKVTPAALMLFINSHHLCVWALWLIFFGHCAHFFCMLLFFLRV